MAENNQKPIAIIAQGGKQLLVKAGDRVIVNRLTVKEGDAIDTPNLIDNTTVSLKVVGHQLGPKINGLKFKNKVRYLRRYGHRQDQTVLEVVSIAKETPKAPASKRPVAKKVTKDAKS